MHITLKEPFILGKSYALFNTIYIEISKIILNKHREF